MRLAQFLHEGRMVISNYQQEILLPSGEQNPEAAGSDLVSFRPCASAASVSAVLPPFFPLLSHAKAQVCVKQTQLYLPLHPGGQSSDIQSVPKVRQLNWGAALQFHSVYTPYPKNAIYTKAGSRNSYFFLILPNQKLYCTRLSKG